MFLVEPDPDGAALWVRLSGSVTLPDLNRRAAAMTCEFLLDTLAPGSRIYADLTGLQQVEPEARGVLVFLLQRALRMPGVAVSVVAAPALQRALRQTPLGRALSHPRVRVLGSRQEALEEEAREKKLREPAEKAAASGRAAAR